MIVNNLSTARKWSNHSYTRKMSDQKPQSLSKMPRTQSKNHRKSDSSNFQSTDAFSHTPHKVDLVKSLSLRTQRQSFKNLSCTSQMVTPSVHSIMPMKQPIKTISKISMSHTDQLWKLRVNDLFFCVQCFKYVFRIEFDHHYPKCRDPTDLKDPNLKQVGKCKLRLIRQLIGYLGEGEKLKKRIDEIMGGSQEIVTVLDSRKGHFYLVQDIAYVIEMIHRTFFIG